MIKWSRYGTGYEVSSRGDARFSALYATMPDRRPIEHWYQCDIKGYDLGGTSWRLGKGKPSLINYPGDQQWELYLSLWRLWSIHNHGLLVELGQKVQIRGNRLTDMFATSDINQARALATILNEWVIA